MMGAADNDHANAFYRADMHTATLRMIELVRKYRPSVIVTYDENGFYGHPDHINAHRMAVGAYYRAGDAGHADGLEPYAPAKLYYTAIGKSQFEEFGRWLHELGIAPPGVTSVDGDTDPSPPDWGTPDALVTTCVDVSAYVSRKRRALWAHATQMGPEVFFARLPEHAFDQMFAQEQFRLAHARTPFTPPETDLFAGLR